MTHNVEDHAESVKEKDFAVMFQWLNDVWVAINVFTLKQRYGMSLKRFDEVIATADLAK